MSEPQAVPEKPKPVGKGEERAASLSSTYRDAFKDAEKAKALTDTAAWQALYAGRRKLIANARQGLKNELERLAAIAGETGLSENSEKECKEVAKSSEVVRSEAEYFDRQTVAPVRACSEKCQSIIDGARNEAVLYPLLAGDIEAAIKKFKPVTWDQTTGRIMI